ncbi:ferredoxin family protein [Trinickia sp. NRRL B-1857]|uniref:4Fe-4S binding protein n=1 Tax=Trinickia sp. NRRL B-1857 TaxID=3162879 RepID=UPI003D297457
MTFVVTEPCIKCTYKHCIDPCPVDCFREGPDFLVIDPEMCIDCNVCATECPVKAIYQDKEVPEDQLEFIEINRRLAPVYQPATNIKVDSAEKDEWASVQDKRHLLQLPEPM